MSTRAFSLFFTPLLLAACGETTELPERQDPASAAPSWLVALPTSSQDAFVAAYEDYLLTDDDEGEPLSLGELLSTRMSEDELIALFKAAPEWVRLELLASSEEHSEDLDATEWGKGGVLTFDDDLPTPPYVTHGRYTDLPVLYCIAEVSPDIGTWGTVIAVATAAQTWSQVSRAKLVYTGSCSEAQIVIDFDSSTEWDYSPFDGVNGRLAHATYPYEGGYIEFDEAETWSTAVQATVAQPIDIQTVALHEFGHALGLEHSLTTSAVMFANYGGSRRTLTSDDIAGIQALYGAPLTSCEFAWANIQNAQSNAWNAYYYADLAVSSNPYDTSASAAKTYAYNAAYWADAAESVLEWTVYEANTFYAGYASYYAGYAYDFALDAALWSYYSKTGYANAYSDMSYSFDGWTMYYAELAESQAMDCRFSG